MSDGPPPSPPSIGEGEGPRTFEELYETWHDHVARWVRAMAGPRSEDREDLVQDVFLSARRAFDRFDGRNPAGWLFKIAKRRVLDQRRSAWFVNLVRGRQDLPPDDLPAEEASPHDTFELRERRRVFYTLLADMSLKRRTVFVLYEVEGYSGEEIAALEGIPLNTVWTRLHHARKDFFEAAARYQKRQR